MTPACPRPRRASPLGRRRATAWPHPPQEGSAEQEGGGIERKRPAGAEAEYEPGRERGAGELCDVLREAGQRARPLDLGLGDRLREQSGGSGAEERLGSPEDGLDRDQVP